MFADSQITEWFTYHPPTNDQVAVYESIRSSAREFAHILNQAVPDGPDKTAAMRKLRECVMTANAAVAFDPGGVRPPSADEIFARLGGSEPVEQPQQQAQARWTAPEDADDELRKRTV